MAEEEEMFAGLNFAALAHFLVRVEMSAIGAEVAYAGSQSGEQSRLASSELGVEAREGRAGGRSGDGAKAGAGCRSGPVLGPLLGESSFVVKRPGSRDSRHSWHVLVLLFI
jgi:hypothetical protein